MTNKPMLSVERDTLEWVLNCWPKEQKGNVQQVIPSQVKELRALLDKPSYPNRLCHADHNAHPYICGCLKGDEEAQRRFDEHHGKAAQPQGEPVAKVKPVAKLHAERLTGRDGEYGVTVEDSEWFNTCRLTGGVFNLYAEQPAPVAGQAQCEECKGWGYHENHHEGGGTECGECDGSGNATVAVAVVMPPEIDREYFNDESMAAGWNECLEEVARLNGVKP